jgi:hypothetical protein
MSTYCFITTVPPASISAQLEQLRLSNEAINIHIRSLSIADLPHSVRILDAILKLSQSNLSILDVLSTEIESVKRLPSDQVTTKSIEDGPSC